MTILQMPVRQLGLMVNSFARASTCGTRLFALLDLDIAVQDAPDAKDLEIPEGVLRFEDVGFAYPQVANRPVLQHLSFEARRGETIGIVGPPGSGKSTIAHLIPRFYDVTSGRITIDGQDIREATLPFTAPGRRGGAAGRLSVHNHDREQHCLWRSLGKRTAHRARKRNGAAAQLRAGAADGLRYRRRRTRRVAVRRPAPAAFDRPHADAASLP